MDDRELIGLFCKCSSKCFCKYDADELRDIGYKKFVQKIPTVELLKKAGTDRERELVSVVAMLDLGGEVAEIMIREKRSAVSCDVPNCRDTLKRKLFKLLRIEAGGKGGGS